VYLPALDGQTELLAGMRKKPKSITHDLPAIGMFSDKALDQIPIFL
jgi:hypothetical protein